MDPGIPVYGNKGCSIHVQEVLRVFKSMSAEIHLFTVKKGKQFLQEFNDVKLHLIDDLPKGDASHRELKAMALNTRLTVFPSLKRLSRVSTLLISLSSIPSTSKP